MKYEGMYKTPCDCGVTGNCERITADEFLELEMFELVKPEIMFKLYRTLRCYEEQVSTDKLSALK